MCIFIFFFHLNAYKIQLVREEENDVFNGKPIDADRKLVVHNTRKNIAIKVDKVKTGWKIRNEEHKVRLKYKPKTNKQNNKQTRSRKQYKKA